MKKRLNSTINRKQLGSMLANYYDNTRDLYTQFGLKKVLDFSDYYDQYRRNPVANRVVKAYVNGCWRQFPVIAENSNTEETTFETLFNDIGSQLSIFSNLKLVDTLSRIGEYAILFIGFNDNQELSTPVDTSVGNEIIFLRSICQNNATFDKLIDDPGNPKYGFPEYYNVIIDNTSHRIHYSRIIHVAENTEENPVLGTPALECIFNNIMALFMISGASAEALYQGAYPGMFFNYKPDSSAPLGVIDGDDSVQDAIENYMQNFHKYLSLDNTDVKLLNSKPESPVPFIDTQLKLVSAGTGIPNRLLTGSEQAQLASGQDRSNWQERLVERNKLHVIPNIIRPFVDKLIETNVLPYTEYNVAFPEYINEDIELANKKENRDAILAYYNSPMKDTISLETYLKHFLKFNSDDIEAIIGGK